MLAFFSVMPLILRITFSNNFNFCINIIKINLLAVRYLFLREKIRFYIILIKKIYQYNKISIDNAAGICYKRLRDKAREPSPSTTTEESKMNRIQKQELEIIKIMIKQAKEQNNKSIAEVVGRRLMNLHRLLNKADQQKLVLWAADNLKI